MPRRIAYLVNQYPMVSHSFIRREIQALERRGFEIMRIALRGWGASLVDEADTVEKVRTRYVLAEGVLPLLVALLRVFVRSPGRLLRAFMLAARVGCRSRRSLPYHFSYVAEACHILLMMRDAGIDHLHAHFATNPAEIAMLVRELGGPSYSFTVHGQDELFFGGLCEKVERADFVAAVSSFGRGMLWRTLPLREWPKVNIVHCGLDDSSFAGEGEPFPDTVRLVCVGRLSAEKGQLLLVEAAAILARKGIRFELVLAGDGPMRHEIEALIERHALADRVTITGWLSGDQVREQIRAARALVLPSFSEGLPVVIMEAMALYRPVIATYVGGIPELVKDGQHGWLVPAGSAEELAEAMAVCLGTARDRLIQMGTMAHHRVKARHAIDVGAAKLAGLFERGTHP